MNSSVSKYKLGIVATFMLLSLFGSPKCNASDSFSSEMSHVISGAALAGYITHRYSDSEYRSWISFGVSTAIVIFNSSHC